MREGRRPDGANYYPAFPYPSFTRIADADLRDLWAYLRSLPPSSQASQPHDLWFIFRWRLLLWPWKWLFFTSGPFQPDAKASAALNRGAYLAQALGHCGECHTPRNFLGGAKQSRFLAGGKLPDGAQASNLTPTRLKKWGDKDLVDFLTTGLTPDGDVVAETMGEVITNTTGKLTPQDLAALIAYLRSLPAFRASGRADPAVAALRARARGRPRDRRRSGAGHAGTRVVEAASVSPRHRPARLAVHGHAQRPCQSRASQARHRPAR